jgi:hypothetical protein
VNLAEVGTTSNLSALLRAASRVGLRGKMTVVASPNLDPGAEASITALR